MAYYVMAKDYIESAPDKTNSGVHAVWCKLCQQVIKEGEKVFFINFANYEVEHLLCRLEQDEAEVMKL